MSTRYGATKCLGEHLAPSLLNGSLNVFVLFIVFRASSEYISERLDGSTHFRFTMPWHPDLWAFPLYHQERAHIQHCRVILCSFAWAGFAVGISDLFQERAEPQGRTLPGAELRTQSHTTPMMSSSMQRSLRRATPS